MKRCILVSCRIQKDKETNDNLMFLVLYRLPSVMSNGGLWYPKTNEAIVNVCVNETKDKQKYDQLLKINPGALFDITYGVNDFTQKTFVALCDLVPGSNLHSSVDLYK